MLVIERLICARSVGCFWACAGSHRVDRRRSRSRVQLRVWRPRDPALSRMRVPHSQFLFVCKSQTRWRSRRQGPEPGGHRRAPLLPVSGPGLHPLPSSAAGEGGAAVSRRGARLCSAWAPAVIECPLLGKGTPYAPGRSLVQQREPNLSGASSVPLGWGRRGSHGRRRRQGPAR